MKKTRFSSSQTDKEMMMMMMISPSGWKNRKKAKLCAADLLQNAYYVLLLREDSTTRGAFAVFGKFCSGLYLHIFIAICLLVEELTFNPFAIAFGGKPPPLNVIIFH